MITVAASAFLFLATFFGIQLAIEAGESHRRQVHDEQSARRHEAYKAKQAKLAPTFTKGLNDPIPFGRTGCGTAHRVNEDEPGWDCHTMGNKICGPTTVKGKKK